MTIALYFRLSRADGDLGMDGKDESNSIENQRLLLRSFVRAREDLEGDIVEYVDDGFTGTNFNRPAFKRMIEDAKKGKVQVIIVKDLSRLGRDYITAGDYIEQIFPILNVRFIAANNGFDSATHTGGNIGLDVAVNNLINTFYSRDLSQKLKSAMKVKWKNGYSTSGNAPFGYLPSKTEKGKYEIDPEAARIVKTIFYRALDGLSTSQIARYLNEYEIPTPGVYNLSHKCWELKEPVAPLSERKWTSSMIRHVLMKYEYTGALVRGRTCNIAVGMRSTKKRDESEWIVAEDVNEPIVSKEVFEKANTVIQKQKVGRFIIAHEHPLKSKVRCGNCRRALTHVLTGDSEFYICHNGLEIGKHSECCTEHYPVKNVESVVWYAIRELLDVLNWLGVKVETKSKEKIKTLSFEEKDLTEQVKLWKSEKIRQYELYADGALPKERYLRIREELSHKIRKAEDKMQENGRERSEQQKLAEDAEHLGRLANEFSSETELTETIVRAFIENVFIYDKKRIEIVFKYEDEIMKLVRSTYSGQAIWQNEPKALCEA